MKGKLFKISSGIFLILMALWVATPKVYIHNLLNHNHHQVVNPISEGVVIDESGANDDDCDFAKYNTPSYFNIFNFLTSFIPSKPQSDLIRIDYKEKVSTKPTDYFSLRAPPAKA